VNVIWTDQLSKTYRGHGGFRQASFAVSKGQVFGCLGPNGAGKSTLVKTLLGLLRPTAGQGQVLGKPLGDKKVRRRIGYLPELFRYHTWLTGEQLLRLHGQLHRMPESQIRQRIPIVLEQIGMLGQEKKKIASYSKGMQQRIGLGCALINDPELLFLDEPTSALDPIGRRQVRDLLVHLKAQGKTIFLNSHLLSEVEAVCDALLILNRGRIVVQGTWEQLQIGSLVGRIRLFCREETELARLRRLQRQKPEWQECVTVMDPPRNGPQAGNTQTRFVQTGNPPPGITLRIVLRTHEEIADWVARLVAEGFAVEEVQVEKPSLEELFFYWIEQQKDGDRMVEQQDGAKHEHLSQKEVR
jgi:ABC-2 type transport system ATP-binding protein